MTLKDEKEILKAIFKIGIDGNSSNAYYVVNEYMNQLPVEAKKLRFSLVALKDVLSELSEKWDKEIDEIIS